VNPIERRIVMNLVGRTLKSKINGALFFVEELKNDNGNEYYIIVDLASGKRVASGKQWFEKGIMQNLSLAE
jgi:hypothetical protein